jgi:hypothetical protein
VLIPPGIRETKPLVSPSADTYPLVDSGLLHVGSPLTVAKGCKMLTSARCKSKSRGSQHSRVGILGHVHLAGVEYCSKRGSVAARLHATARQGRRRGTCLKVSRETKRGIEAWYWFLGILEMLHLYPDLI